MPSLSFDGETHDEIVQQVRHWLAAHDASEDGGPKPADLVNQTAALTKDALRVIAESAPNNIGQSELFKALTEMGYKATDSTKEAALAGLGTLEATTNGSVVKNVADRGTQALFEMNAQVAKQFLKSIMKDK